MHGWLVLTTIGGDGGALGGLGGGGEVAARSQSLGVTHWSPQQIESATYCWQVEVSPSP